MLDVATFINTFGYIGVFLISLVGSGIGFVPLPSFVVVIAAGAILNPLLVGVSAGFGAAIGELVAYAIGFGVLYGHKKLSKKNARRREESKRAAINESRHLGFWKRWFSIPKMRKFFKSRKGPLLIFIFAVTPLPDKVVGFVCGAIKYDVKKFFLFTLIGKIILHIALAYVGFYGIDILEKIPFML